MRNYVYTLAALMLLPAMAGAKSLSPDQALQLALSNSAMRAPGQNECQYTLLLTKQQDDQNTLYVFGKDSQPGFMVVAADDQVQPLVLGYSTEQSIDASNLPPAMNWWMEAASLTVANCATLPGFALRSPNAAESARTDVAPITKTKWNQEAPYNNYCPVVNGQTSVTGCVATAVSQVMKVHEWPAQGQGSNEYSWTYEGETYNTSADFGATTYDWANMTNTYGDYSTQEQQNAVATLMYDCGVAFDMQYSPDDSGASDFTAGQSLIKYFNYDPGIQYLQGSWFTTDEWSQIVYDQLAKGLPVLYGGENSQKEGHEFVLDGYQTDGYFHVNWGWGGMCNGYYQITNLQPEQVGVGGGSGITGFDYATSILINVQPPQSDSEVAGCMGMGEMLTLKDEGYNRNRSTYVWFEGDFYSFALSTANYRFGIHIIGDGIDKYIPYSDKYTEFDPGSGIGSFPIRASELPEGEYDVFCAYQQEGKDWKTAYYDLSQADQALHMLVTAGYVTTIQPTGIANINSENVKVRADGNNIVISGLEQDASVAVYCIDGTMIYSGKAKTIPVSSHKMCIVVTPAGSFRIYAK